MSSTWSGSTGLVLSLLFLSERSALDLHSSSRVLADLTAIDLESVCSTSIPSLMRMTDVWIVDIYIHSCC